MVISRVIGRITTVTTHIKGQITPLVPTREPSKYSMSRQANSRNSTVA